MESEHSQQHLAVPDTENAPPSLLTGVFERLAQRNASIAASRPTHELFAALQDARWEVRAAAAHRLGEMAEDAALEPLLRVMQDKHRLVRAAAIRALGRLGAPLDQLLNALHDADWEVREMAVLALAEMQEPVPRSLLLAAQRDAHSCVREAASHALQRLDLRRSVGQSQPRVSLAIGKSAYHLWLTFVWQIPVVSKSIWIGTPLLMLLWCIKAFFLSGSLADTQQNNLELALVTTVVAAVGSAFIYGHENDASFELTLTTLTSIRLVMLCRFALVILYNFVIAALVSAFVALAHGGSWWEVVQLWLGPMLLVSTLTLTLSLLISSWLALLGGMVLEITQSTSFNDHLSGWTLVSSSYWHTTPVILALAALCLAVTIFYAPRQPRLSS
jgi:hypothetical protein